MAADVKGVAGEVDALGKETRRRLSAIEGEGPCASGKRPNGPSRRNPTCLES